MLREQRDCLQFLAVHVHKERGDLYARIAGLTLEVPPLRERREDVGLLLAQFLADAEEGAAQGITHEACRALMRYDWPYNVRELQKAVAVALALAGAGADKIKLAHLPEPLRAAAGEPLPRASRPPSQAVPAASRVKRERVSDETLRSALEDSLRRLQGNVSAVARELDTTRMQVHRWAKRLGLDLDSYR